MSTCPNKNSKEYKQLEKQVGEFWAIATFQTYSGFPEMFTNTQLRNDMGIPYKATSLQRALAAKRVKRYNNHHGTSHRFISKQIGKMDRYELELIPSYLPVSVRQDVEWQYARTEGKFQEQSIMNSSSDGIYDMSAEERVVILSDTEYEANGEIYSSYEDAINAIESLDEDLEYSLPVPAAPDVQDDLDNLNITRNLLSYLYDISSTKKTQENFSKVATGLINRMRSSFTVSEILDEIKCI